LTDRPTGGRSATVDLAALLRRPGTRREVAVDLEPDDVALSDVRVDRVSGSVTVESMGEKLHVSGVLDLGWTGICRRCLESTSGHSDLAIDEVFEASPLEGETYPLPDEELLDLTEMLLEQAVLSLPLAPLCRSGCEGPAPESFPALVADDDEGEEDEAPRGDPRWAVLDELDFGDRSD
jgi:uncharacterized protein